MICVVSGYRRCGTSLMMQALNAGGMGIIYLPGLEFGNPDNNNYQPNPGGLYEVGMTQYMNAKFLRLLPDDCTIKILFDGLPFLPKRDYKIIWMSRDVEEIEASTERVDEHILSQQEYTTLDGKHMRKGPRGLAGRDATHITRILPFCVYRPYDQAAMDHVAGICEARSDMEVIPVRYQDVIDNPGQEFELLKGYGLPLDVEAAAATVNPDFHRVRKAL